MAALVEVVEIEGEVEYVEGETEIRKCMGGIIGVDGSGNDDFILGIVVSAEDRIMADIADVEFIEGGTEDCNCMGGIIGVDGSRNDWFILGIVVSTEDRIMTDIADVVSSGF